MMEYAKTAPQRGLKVIIAGAGASGKVTFEVDIKANSVSHCHTLTNYALSIFATGMNNINPACFAPDGCRQAAPLTFPAWSQP